MRHKKLIILVSILLLVAVLVGVGSHYLTINGKLRLSLLSEKQLHRFLEKYNVSIPEPFKDAKIWPIIVQYEVDPYLDPGFGWTDLYDLYANIGAAVREYYGVEDRMPYGAQ